MPGDIGRDTQRGRPLKIVVDIPRGLSPKTSPEDLILEAAQTAENCNLGRGDIRPWKRPLKDRALSLTSVSGYFQWIANDTEYWLESANALDSCGSPVASDSYERMYYTGESEMRALANDNISATFTPSSDYYKVGVPAPTTAPTIARSGSTTRYYVGCYVTAYGEEGLPSAIGGGTDVAASPVGISGIADAPTGRRITTYRVYRTASGTAGTAEFFKVFDATWFSTATSYAIGDFVIYSNTIYKCTSTHTAGAWNAGHFTAGDDVTDENLSSTVCPSTTWSIPDAAMRGLGVLPNGAMFGFSGNELCFSVPNRPHAWPSGYRLSFPYDIVATVASGTNVVVLTEGYPYIVYGTHPENMLKKRLDYFYPCISKRSAIAAMGGVYYISKEGLIWIGPDSEVNNVTFTIMDVQNLEDYHPTTIHAAFYQGQYFGFYKSGTDSGGIIIDVMNKIMSTTSLYASATHVTPDDGNFYVVIEDAIDEDDPPDDIPLCSSLWNGSDYNNLITKWKSKKFVFDSYINFAACRMYYDDSFYQDMLDLAEDDSYILTQNATHFTNATPVITGDTDSFTGQINDTIKVTINSVDYDNIDISACTSISDVVSAINTDVGWTCASETDDGYLKITGHIGNSNVIIADGSATGQTVVGELFSDADNRWDKATDLGGSYGAFIYARNAYGGDLLQSTSDVEVYEYNTLKVYCDGTLKLTTTVDTPNIFMLPSGFRGREWEFQIEGTIPVKRIEFATSVRELIHG